MTCIADISSCRCTKNLRYLFLTFNFERFLEADDVRYIDPPRSRGLITTVSRIVLIRCRPSERYNLASLTGRIFAGVV
jgi:hypothetical protein